jgi:hypothetical protein
MTGYYAEALAYREYAADVADVAKAWDAIRDDWSRYYRLLSQRQQAIAQRQQWLAAAKAWPANRCSSRGQAPPAGKQQGAPAPGCEVPQILWKPLPQIPPEPKPPADPRPRSAR